MNKKIKVLSIMMVLAMSLSAIAGCSGTEKQEAEVGKIAYPEKAIQVVIPYSPGGDTDLNARTVSKYLQKELGKPVVVSNVTGSSGVVAIRKVADCDPDGYTVLFHHNAMLIGNILGTVEETFRDFEAGGIGITSEAQVWAVKTSSGIKNLNDVVDKVKAAPGEFKFATLFGNFTHLEALAFEKAAGVSLKKVDAGGAADHLAALLGGHVDMISIQYSLIKDYVTKGDITVVGVLAPERNDLLPDVSTFREQNIDVGFQKVYFFSFPKNTPKEIVDVFTQALKRVSEDSEYKVEANKMFMTAKYFSPEETVEYLGDTADLYQTFKDALFADKK